MSLFQNHFPIESSKLYTNCECKFFLGEKCLGYFCKHQHSNIKLKKLTPKLLRETQKNNLKNNNNITL